jgi:hypothetical protein
LKVDVVWTHDLAVLGDGSLIWRCLLVVLLADEELAMNVKERLEVLPRNDLMRLVATWQCTHGSLQPWHISLQDCRSDPAPEDPQDAEVVQMFLLLIQQARWAGNVSDYRTWLPGEAWPDDDSGGFGNGDVHAPIDPPPPVRSPGYREPVPA